MRYRVLVREVHVSHRIVEAPGPEEAKIIAAMEGDEDYCEYSHTLDADTWTVEIDKDNDDPPALKEEP